MYDIASFLRSREAVTIIGIVVNTYLLGIFGWAFIKEPNKGVLQPAFALLVERIFLVLLSWVILFWYSVPRPFHSPWEGALLFTFRAGSVVGGMLMILVFAPRFRAPLAIACGVSAAGIAAILYALGMMA